MRITMLRRTWRGGWEEAQNGRGGRSPAWKTALPTRDAKRWPTLGRGAPCPGIRRRKASLRGENGCEVRRRSESAGHPLPALDRRLDRRTSRKFVHRDEDLVNYLLSIYNILFATGGCCATAERGKCGFTRWWLWRKRRKKKKRTYGTRVVWANSFGCVNARPGVRTSKCKRACAERVERKTRKRRG